jgi:hypothetical protein
MPALVIDNISVRTTFHFSGCRYLDQTQEDPDLTRRALVVEAEL